MNSGFGADFRNLPGLGQLSAMPFEGFSFPQAAYEPNVAEAKTEKTTLFKGSLVATNGVQDQISQQGAQLSGGPPTSDSQQLLTSLEPHHQGQNQHDVEDALISSQIQLLKLQTMENIMQLQKQLPTPAPKLNLLNNLMTTTLDSSFNIGSSGADPIPSFGCNNSNRSQSPLSVSSLISPATMSMYQPSPQLSESFSRMRALQTLAPSPTPTSSSEPARMEQVNSQKQKYGKRSYARAFKPRLCTVEGCTTQDKGGGLCAKHGGGKPCAFGGCIKRVAGTKFCSAHGGTRKKRCSFPECAKGDQGGGFCAAHGGGKRCSVSECAKRAVGKGLCWSHGGGKRCRMTTCNKSPVSNGYCSTHAREALLSSPTAAM